jgi:hypothetical protein
MLHIVGPNFDITNRKQSFAEEYLNHLEITIT